MSLTRSTSTYCIYEDLPNDGIGIYADHPNGQWY